MYGPSARLAYTMLSDGVIERYASTLRKTLLKMEIHQLERVILETSALSFDEGISHKILLVTPGVNREDSRIDLMTRHVFNMLHEAFADHWHARASRMYKLFLAAPETRATASYFLEDACHRAFVAGGSWPVKRLIRNPKQPWIIEDGSQLVIGRRSDIDRSTCHVLEICEEGTEMPFSTDHIPFVRDGCDAHSAQDFTLEDGYYRPCAKNEPTLDSFVYDSTTKTITMFQITVSDSHRVNAKGLTWLQTLRDKRYPKHKPIIHYVAITPNPCDFVRHNLHVLHG